MEWLDYTVYTIALLLFLYSYYLEKKCKKIQEIRRREWAKKEKAINEAEKEAEERKDDDYVTDILNSTNEIFDTTLSCMQNEIILQIMKNLSIYDKMSLSMTCKRFYELFNSLRTLNSNKLIKVTQMGYDNFFEQIEDHGCMVTNIEFTLCNFDDYHESFWKKHGENIITLSIQDCYFKNNEDENILLKILSYCPNITHFKLIHYGSRIKFNWKKALNKCSILKYENLTDLEATCFSDYSFNNFIKNAPNLEFLITNYCEMIDDTNQIFEYCISILFIDNEEDKKIIMLADEECLNKSNVLNILPNARKLKYCSLEFHPCIKIDDLCNLRMNLQYIRINPTNYVPRGFELLSKTFGDCLQSLDLTSFTENLKQQIKGLNKFKNLKILKIPNFILNSTFMEIKSLKNLQVLQLNSRTGNREHRIFKLADVLNGFSKLKSLLFAYCDLPDVHVFLNETKSELEELDFSRCIMRQSEVINVLIKKHKKLEKFTLIDTHSGEFSAISYEQGASLRSLKHLKYLNLGVNMVNTLTVIQQFRSNVLTFLNLSRSAELTNRALLSISKYCPALVELNLNFCLFITDEGVKYLCDLPRLRMICLLQTCVTGKGVLYLINSKCPITECLVSCCAFRRYPKVRRLLAEKMYHNKHLSNLD